MSGKYQKLFDPINIGKVKIKNRFFMAPMGAVGMVEQTGAFSKKGIDYYVERAKGGTGLIITGVTNVANPVEKFPPGFISTTTVNPFAFLQAGQILTERVQAYGSKIFLQLGVGFGRAMVPAAIASGAGAKAPSEIENRWNPNVKHEAFTTEEVESIVKKTIEGAVLAKMSGFDGVEIHAVHEGYLLDQFTLELFNKRDDKYGGSFENRYRMAAEILQGIKRACGPDFPVTLRYSVKSFIKGIRQGGLPGEDFKELGRDVEEGIAAAKLLAEAGYDALNIDCGTYDSWYWNHPPMYFEDGMYLPFGKMVKDAVNVPVMVAGRMDNPDLAISALEDGSADMIGLGRPLLADAFIPEKIRRNQVQQIRPCLSCQDGCLGRLKEGKAISCAVNPAAAREDEYGIKKADQVKNVLVVGGGVAGMETARVCNLRGHHVTLLEKSDKLGGSLIPGGMPSFKRYDHKLVAWYESELKRLGVDVRKNTSATTEQIKDDKWDSVVIATGAKPIELRLKGSERNRVFNAVEVSLDPAKAGEEIAIIGAGLVGAEIGLWLAQKGKKVTIVELTNQILGGEHAMCFANYDMLKDLLNFNKVKIMTETAAEEVTKEGLLVKNTEGETLVKADTIITAVGYQSVNSLFEEVSFLDKEAHLLGDAKNVRNIMYAIWDSYEVARAI